MSAEWIGLLAVLLVAGAAQRMTGLGFALIATPIALVVVGAGAVPFVAAIGALSSLLALAATWRSLRPRAIALLCLATVLAMLPGLLLARSLGPAVSSLVAGALVIVATAMSGEWRVVWARRLLGSVLVAGAGTGLMAALAGLSGPVAAAHGTVKGWGESFVPNLQLVLLITLPLIVAGHGWPRTVSPLSLGLSIAVVLAGTLAGGGLRRLVRPSTALALTRLLALAGGVFALVRGLATL